MSEAIKPRQINVQIIEGQPYLCFDVGPGNFWELMPCPHGRRAGRWVLLHWVPANIGPDTDADDMDCDDVKEFDSFEGGLVAFGTVVRIVREGFEPKRLKELVRPQGDPGKPLPKQAPLPKHAPMPADQTLHLSRREIGTILAALRFYQAKRGMYNLWPQLEEIASDSGSFTPLDSDQIDTLCEGINC